MPGRRCWELLRWEFCASCFLYQSMVHQARRINPPPNFYWCWRAFHPDAMWPERVFNSICKILLFEMLYLWPLHLLGSKSKGFWPLHPLHLRLLNSDWLVCVWRCTCNIPGGVNCECEHFMFNTAVPIKRHNKAYFRFKIISLVSHFIFLR